MTGHVFLRNSLISGVTVALIAGATALLSLAQSAPPAQSAAPGAQTDNTTLLHNGWRLAPTGRHLGVGSLPLNMIQSLDSRYLVVSNNGIGKPSLHVVDVG